MLSRASLIAFIPVSDLATARDFYIAKLGFAVTDQSPFALVVDANGTMLRLTPVGELRTQPFTIVGWAVDDIVSTVDNLVSLGVQFNRYDGMAQDARGIWTSPNGDLVAWFTDPDGNTLSLTRFMEG